MALAPPLNLCPTIDIQSLPRALYNNRSVSYPGEGLYIYGPTSHLFLYLPTFLFVSLSFLCAMDHYDIIIKSTMLVSHHCIYMHFIPYLDLYQPGAHFTCAWCALGWYQDRLHCCFRLCIFVRPHTCLYMYHVCNDYVLAVTMSHSLPVQRSC